MNRIKNLLRPLLAMKAVVAAAIITAASSITLALLSSNELTLSVEGSELKFAVLFTSSPEYETISNLREELSPANRPRFETVSK